MTGRTRFAICTAVVGVALGVLVTESRSVVASTQEGGFLLGGSAMNALDPENPANEVVKVNTVVAAGTVSRRLGVKISALDNMLEFKSYFQNRSCGGGSPRIQLSVDLDGDGNADGNLFGYTAPPFTACLPNRWQYDDLTDELPRWDVSQLIGAGFPQPTTICANPLFSANPVVCPVGGFQTHSGYIPWVVMETVLSKVFPLHRICSGALVDDSGWMPAAAGVAYYDIISMGRATWEDWGDTAGRGFAMGCSALDHGDDDHDGDENHDHHVDDGDHGWRERHGS